MLVCWAQDNHIFFLASNVRSEYKYIENIVAMNESHDIWTPGKRLDTEMPKELQRSSKTGFWKRNRWITFWSQFLFARYVWILVKICRNTKTPNTQGTRGFFLVEGIERRSLEGESLWRSLPLVSEKTSDIQGKHLNYNDSRFRKFTSLPLSQLKHEHRVRVWTWLVLIG